MGRGWVHGVRLAAGAKKGRLFTKISKEITVAVKSGGENPEGNPRLRSALKDAQKNSVPRDTIERAIKRGLGHGDEANFDEITYEGYGPHGVAVLVETLTDNRNRTVQELRASFDRGGGNLGEGGSVAWMFDRVGSLIAKAPKSDVDAEEAAIVSGANEVEPVTGEEQTYHFISAPSEIENVHKGLQDLHWDVIKAELSFKAKNPIPLTNDQEPDLQKFLELVDDSDDVKRIHLAI